MDETFKVSDVVQLRSGGPLMTISQIQEGNARAAGKTLATCKWWNGTKYEEDFLDIRLLKLAHL